MKKIFITEPFIPNRVVLARYIDRALDAKRLTNNGPLVNELTDKLSNYLNVDNLLLVANGTVAISLAIKVLGISDKILTTPFSWVASSSAPVWDGIPVTFSDISRSDYNLDVGLLNEKIANENIGGILPVHVFGRPADVEKIDGIAASKRIPVIYDAAHAFGVRKDGKSILCNGDISTLSLHSTKMFHTVEGGALAFRDADILKEAKKMINFGIGNEGVERLGVNYKLSEIHAAMGLAILEQINEIIEQKRYIYEFYKNKLGDHVVFQNIENDTEWNYAYCPILLESETKTIELLSALEEGEVLARRYFYPSLNTLNFLSAEDDCPVSNDVASRILCLPSYVGLEDRDLDRVVEIVKRSC